MSEIKAGDLVMVVRPKPCCGASEDIGAIVQVLYLDGAPGECEDCGTSYTSLDAVYAEDHGIGKCWAHDISRLIRIDPSALPESVETDREVTA